MKSFYLHAHLMLKSPQMCPNRHIWPFSTSKCEASHCWSLLIIASIGFLYSISIQMWPDLVKIMLNYRKCAVWRKMWTRTIRENVKQFAEMWFTYFPHILIHFHIFSQNFECLPNISQNFWYFYLKCRNIKMTLGYIFLNLIPFIF